MTATRITCESCHHSWHLKMSMTEYTQQAFESSACPKCGAKTLICHEGERTREPAGVNFRRKIRSDTRLPERNGLDGTGHL